MILRLSIALFVFHFAFFIVESLGDSRTGRFARSAEKAVDGVKIDATSVEKIQPLVEFPKDLPAHTIVAQLFEGISDKRSWDFVEPRVSESYHAPAFALTGIPRKYSPKGIIVDRKGPLLFRAVAELDLPEGDYRFLLRSQGAARLKIDGQIVAELDFPRGADNGGHEEVPNVEALNDLQRRPLPPAHREKIISIHLDDSQHRIAMEVIVGNRGMRQEFGESVVAVSTTDKPWMILAHELKDKLTDDGWEAYVDQYRHWLTEYNAERRMLKSSDERNYWKKRHGTARKHWKQKKEISIPEVPSHFPIRSPVDYFIGAKIAEENAVPAPLIDQWTFMRRVTLDLVGTIPTRAEIKEFLEDTSLLRRANLIDRLLEDPRWADHWVGYWQDVLAENPGILKPKLNNTGPFRWWIQESFLDNKPMDRFATELIMMEGSRYGGGPAGFAMSTQNDAPMAAKAHVIAKALLAVEMKCARCHDAPYHDIEQRDTFRLAAMLNNGPHKIPKTSVVPLIPGGRTPAVTVALKPGEEITPVWPFVDFVSTDIPDGVLRGQSERERLAAIITSPENIRYAQVIVNRLWKRYFGQGIVEPVDDWENAEPSNPQLLEFLSRELITHGYDLKHIARLILTSHTYQQQLSSTDDLKENARVAKAVIPVRRRLSAEQIVDSLFLAVGKQFKSEPLNLDPQARRSIKTFMNLGTPRRAWEFASLSNERDRPALSLPASQSIVDVLSVFGWRESRQDPITDRDETPTVLQPAILANGVVGSRITRLSDDSALTDLCLQSQSLDQLVREVYLRFLTRLPNLDERQMFVALLQPGYDDRLVNAKKLAKTQNRIRQSAVSWSNHLNPEATKIKLEIERVVQAGDLPTARLRPQWRERMEDMVWALINSPEFIFAP